MRKGRMLAMTILFFAAIATMAPLAFFAGLERGRGGIAAHAAELSQTEPSVENSQLLAASHPASVTVCNDDPSSSGPPGTVLCDTRSSANKTASPGSVNVADIPKSQALSSSVVAAIAETGKTEPDAPVELAIAPDIVAPSAPNGERETMTSPGFPSGGGVPGSLTPFALTGPGAPLPTPLPPQGPSGAAPPAEPPISAPPVTVVPLPAAISLFSGGLALLAAFGRRKRRIQADT